MKQATSNTAQYTPVCFNALVHYSVLQCNEEVHGTASNHVTYVQVVGRAEPPNLALIHPEQDRVLTIRENARTQVCLT